MSKMFVGLFSIWHTADEKYYEPGDRVKMDHLTEGQVESLVDRGVFMPAEQFRLGEIRGLNAEQQKALIEMKLYDLEKLVQADPAEIAKGVPGASPATAVDWQEQAGKLLKAPSPPTPLPGQKTGSGEGGAKNASPKVEEAEVEK